VQGLDGDWLGCRGCSERVDDVVGEQFECLVSGWRCQETFQAGGLFGSS
jgi:hypothetical protein